ncbi:hypothetical protein ZIOFF_021871 [Zingiber officinale]|uniref:Uncharacterized protein n=1 Tax=Zingiber officinale TaxID=94328 RepID=A0A8J5H0S0_ZINOF|nr:hypothetical protein ZIOFF_021871 [Zingiber officinale]
MLRYQAFRQGAHLRLAVFRPPPRNPVRPRDLVQQVIDYRFVLFAFGTMMSSSSGPGVSCRYSFKILLISDTGVGKRSLLVSFISNNLLFNMGSMGALSNAIGDLTKLQLIDFSNNKYLNGQLPPSIGNLKKLQTLILIGCKFSGTIPVELGNLSQLQTLRLDRNNLIGPVPQSISNLTRLKVLNFANNELTGMIPNMTGMHALYNL